MADNSGNTSGSYMQTRQEVMQGVTIAKDVKAVSKFIGLLIQISAGFWQVLLRYEFGERYLRAFSITAVFMCFLMMISVAIMDFGLIIFGVIYYTAFAAQYRMAWRRHHVGSVWHSRSPGISVFERLVPSRPTSVIYDWVLEPGIPFVFGLVFVWQYPVFGLLSIVSSIGILWLHLRRYWETRDMILDQIDQQIEAKNMASILEGDSDPKKHQGFEIAGVNKLSDTERDMVRQSLTQLDPSINTLLDPAPETPTPTPTPETPEMTPDNPDSTTETLFIKPPE